MSFIGYILVYPIVWLLAFLPLRVLYIISDGLYYLIFNVVKYRRKIVYDNLRKAFPEKNEKEIDAIAKKFFRYFADIFVETIKLIHISKKELTRRIKYKNPEILDDLFQKQKQCIVVMGHYGNWEWLLGVTPSKTYHTMSLYKPLSNKYIDNAMRKIRTRYGSDIIPMGGAIRTILKYNQEKRLTLSCFISDQNPIASHIQYWTTFLNQDTPILLGVEKIAIQINAAVLFYKILRVKRGYYEIEIVKLFEEVKGVDPHLITESHVRELEKTIINQPEYWLWTHRRWKLSHLRYQNKNNN